MGKDASTPQHTLEVSLGSNLLSSLGASISHIPIPLAIVCLAPPLGVKNNTSQPLPNAQLKRLTAFCCSFLTSSLTEIPQVLLTQVYIYLLA